MFSYVALRPQRTSELLGTESPWRPAWLSHSPWALCILVVGWVLLYVHRNRRLIRDGSPGRPPRRSHSSLALKVYSGSDGVSQVALNTVSLSPNLSPGMSVTATVLQSSETTYRYWNRSNQPATGDGRRPEPLSYFTSSLAIWSGVQSLQVQGSEIHAQGRSERREVRCCDWRPLARIAWAAAFVFESDLCRAALLKAVWAELTDMCLARAVS